MSSPTRRLLVVADDVQFARDALGARHDFSEVRTARDAASACRLLAGWLPDVVVLGPPNADGAADRVLEALRGREPAPLVIAVASAAGEALPLAMAGVTALAGRSTRHEPRDEAAPPAPALDPHVRQLVGLRPLRAVEEDVRAAMVAEALARAGGSRRGAARLLGISRQLLQHILRGHP